MSEASTGPGPNEMPSGSKLATSIQPRGTLTNRRWPALAYTALIVYGSLYPFSGLTANPDPLGFIFSAERRARASYGDLVTNVVAYFPLGFLLARYLRSKVHTAAEVSLAISAAGLLSLAMEVLQGYLPSRVQSMYDLLANTVGAAAGVIGAQLLQSPGSAGAWVRRLREDWLVPGRTANVGAYAVLCWALSWLVPFVPSLDVGKFRHALSPLDHLVAFPETFNGWRLLIETFSYAGFGLIIDALVRPRKRGVAAFATIVFVLMLGQVAIVKRQLVPEVMAGSALAIVVVWAMRDLDVALRANAAFFLLFAGFCVEESMASGAGSVQAFNWIPFVDQLGNTVNGIESLLGLTAFAAALAWSTRMGATRDSARWRSWVAGSLVTGGALALEYRQQYIPGRIGDITTPLVMGLTWISAWRFSARGPGPALAEPPLSEPRPMTSTAGCPRVAPAAGGAMQLGRSGSPLVLYLAPLIVLAAAIWTLTRLPFIPYNVRQVLYWGHPVRSAFLIAVACYLTFAVPVWFAGWMSRHPPFVVLLPFALVVNASLAYLAVVSAVPSRSIHDIVGFPVLQWPADSETWLRFVALHGAAVLLATGGAAIALALRFRRFGPLWGWALIAALCAPLLHWAIVTRAATDNLTELMRGGGSPLATAFLSSAAVVTFAAGSMVASDLAALRRRLPSLTFAILSGIAVYGLVVAGTEPAIEKYGKVFSALQFMLSPDRSHYVGPGELIARYAIAYALQVGAIVLLQYSSWRAIGPWVTCRESRTTNKSTKRELEDVD